jgi:hypothetical protein
MVRYGLNGSDGQQGEDRSGVDPENRWRRFLRFTVSPDSENAALQCGRRSTVHRSMLTPTPTWTGPWDHDSRPRCGATNTHAPSSLQNIRLSSDAGNPLSRSQN